MGEVPDRQSECVLYQVIPVHNTRTLGLPRRALSYGRRVDWPGRSIPTGHKLEYAVRSTVRGKKGQHSMQWAAKFALPLRKMVHLEERKRESGPRAAHAAHAAWNRQG